MSDKGIRSWSFAESGSWEISPCHACSASVAVLQLNAKGAVDELLDGIRFGVDLRLDALQERRALRIDVVVDLARALQVALRE